MTQLNKALLANALFSLITGVCALTFQSDLSSSIPIPSWMWLVVGLGLIGFSLQLVLMVKIQWLAKKLIISVIWADAGWVAITSILSIIYQSQITQPGLLLIGFTSLVVGCLAIAQYSGYRQEPGFTQ